MTPDLPPFQAFERLHEPFEAFTCTDTLPKRPRAQLEAMYDAALPWVLHDDSFYRAWLCDVEDELSPPFLEAMVRSMSAATGLRLTPRVRVTLQRMETGQYAGVHSDRPLVGYESARLVVQLQRNWRPAYGGVFELHGDASGGHPVMSRAPVYNAGFGFVMHPGTFHAVTPVAQTRRSVVFNFWHVGNSEDLRSAVAGLFRNLDFGELRAPVARCAAEAEAFKPEDITFAAALVATALQRWGYPDDAVVAGYRHVAYEEAAARPEHRLAIRLAAWAAHLRDGEYDLARWCALRAEHDAYGMKLRDPAEAFRVLCFPTD